MTNDEAAQALLTLPNQMGSTPGPISHPADWIGNQRYGWLFDAADKAVQNGTGVNVMPPAVPHFSIPTAQAPLGTQVAENDNPNPPLRMDPIRDYVSIFDRPKIGIDGKPIKPTSWKDVKYYMRNPDKDKK